MNLVEARHYMEQNQWSVTKAVHNYRVDVGWELDNPPPSHLAPAFSDPTLSLYSSKEADLQKQSRQSSKPKKKKGIKSLLSVLKL
jgi:hypothetical protein